MQGSLLAEIRERAFNRVARKSARCEVCRFAAMQLGDVGYKVYSFVVFAFAWFTYWNTRDGTPIFESEGFVG